MVQSFVELDRISCDMLLHVPPLSMAFYCWTGLLVSIIAIAIWVVRWVRPERPDRTGNGISAGAIKVYDNRFLYLRLE